MAVVCVSGKKKKNAKALVELMGLGHLGCGSLPNATLESF